MRADGPTGTILAMTRPVTSSKFLLIADRRTGETEAATGVRRFRLARVRLNGRPAAPAVPAGVAQQR